MKKNQINSLAILLAALWVSPSATADTHSFLQILPAAEVSSRVAPDFSSMWSTVDSFISAHGVNPSPMVREALKCQAQAGTATWMCIGNQVGWPAGLDSSVITFDSSANASTCAQLIMNATVSDH